MRLFMGSTVNFRSTTTNFGCRKTNTDGIIPMIRNWYSFHIPKGQSLPRFECSTIAVFPWFWSSKFRYADPFCVGISSAISHIFTPTTTTSGWMVKSKPGADRNANEVCNTSKWDFSRFNWSSCGLICNFITHFKLASPYRSPIMYCRFHLAVTVTQKGVCGSSL